jgi:hypothetical protein
MSPVSLASATVAPPGATANATTAEGCHSTNLDLWSSNMVTVEDPPRVWMVWYLILWRRRSPPPSFALKMPQID